MPLIAVPEQVKIASELARSVHDPGDLADDDGRRSASVQGLQQLARVEADGVVGRDCPGDVVSGHMVQPGRRPPPSELGHLPCRLIEPPQRGVGPAQSRIAGHLPGPEIYQARKSFRAPGAGGKTPAPGVKTPAVSC